MNNLKSMTGFGRSVKADNRYNLVFEIRSVNGRFLDIKWRLPSLVRAYENSFEKIVKQHSSRGRIEISLSLQSTENPDQVHFNAKQAHKMIDLLRDFAKDQNEDYVVDYNNLLKVSSLWAGTEEDIDDVFIDFVQDALRDALEDWNHSRIIEGEELAKDLSMRFERMKTWLSKIENKAPHIKELRFLNVKDRLQELLLSLESNLEESRFLQEMVILSDKLDVSEETTRLHSHFKRLESLLEIGEEAGRKLDFTLQECFREINTCGNKIQDAELSILVVEFKNELEKCREQVQNLE